MAERVARPRHILGSVPYDAAYAIARPALRGALGEGARCRRKQDPRQPSDPSAQQGEWSRFIPIRHAAFPRRANRAHRSGDECARVVARRDARSGRFSDDARTALGVNVAAANEDGPQERRVDLAGLRLEPWESPNSPYFGAPLRRSPPAPRPKPTSHAGNPGQLKILRAYFPRETTRSRRRIN